MFAAAKQTGSSLSVRCVARLGLATAKNGVGLKSLTRRNNNTSAKWALQAQLAGAAQAQAQVPATGRALFSTSSSGVQASFERVCRELGPKVAAEGENRLKLRAYALFKQATVGPAATSGASKPSSFDIVGKFKYEAWSGLGIMSREEAMRVYVQEVTAAFPTTTTTTAAAAAAAPAAASSSSTGGATSAGDSAAYGPGPDTSLSRGSFLPVLSRPMLPPGTFTGQVVFVTGGGTGLGKAMTATLSALGATVVIASRREAVCADTARELNALLEQAKAGQGPLAPVAATAHGYPTPVPVGKVLAGPSMDVRSPEAVTAVLDWIQRETGQCPNIVLNNAAGNFVLPFERMSANAVSAIVDIVLKGTANVTLEAGKRMIAAGKGGVFLQITTTYAPEGSGYVTASAAAKSGVHALMKSLATEWGSTHGIRFVGVAPGPIETKGAFSRLDPQGKFKSFLTQRLPAQRLGHPAELSNAVAYLVSPYASWASGSVLLLDGGESAAISGEFNALHGLVKKEEWDVIEALGKGSKGGAGKPKA